MSSTTRDVDREFDDALRATLDAAIPTSVGLETGSGCPDFFRFLDARDGWTPSEEAHVRACRSCERRLAMVARAADADALGVANPTVEDPELAAPGAARRVRRRRDVAAAAVGVLVALCAVLWTAVGLASARAEREHRAELRLELARQRTELAHQRFLIQELSRQQEALHDELRTMIHRVERQLNDDERQLREQERELAEPDA